MTVKRQQLKLNQERVTRCSPSPQPKSRKADDGCGACDASETCGA